MLKYTSKYLILSAVMLLLFISLSCKRSVSPTYTDVDAIMNYIEARPDIFRVDVFDTSSTDPNFYRQITKRENWIKISFGEPDASHDFRYANVYWDDTLQGVFHTYIGGTEYTKEFRAFSRVRAYFEQWGSPGDVYRGWLLTKVSNGEVYSFPRPGGFGQVVVTYGGSDKSVSVDQLYDLSSALEFDKFSEVTFTMQVADTSDVYNLHIYENGSWRKIPFDKVSGKQYEVSWTTSSSTQDIYKHAYIDYIDYESVAVDTAKYSSRAWAILYKIK